MCVAFAIICATVGAQAAFMTAAQSGKSRIVDALLQSLLKLPADVWADDALITQLVRA